jgi:urea transport system ATP-binding protein
MGLTTRMTGTLHINGIDSSGLATHERSTSGLGYVPQGRGILPKFTVKENILLGTFARQDGKQVIPEICLNLFPYLADNLQKRAGSLSGGQQQQLALARALATDPRILLLDEPTEGIQPNIVSEIEGSLLRLKTELGKALILTEQHIKVAKAVCDLFIVMDQGQVVESGPISELTEETVDKYLAL